MRIRRLATTGLAVMATLTLGVAGCNDRTGTDAAPGGGSVASTAAGTTEQSPKEALTAAARKLGEDTLKVRMTTTGMEATGAMDPAAKQAAMVMDITAGSQQMKIDIAMLQSDIYLKMTGVPSLPKEWMHLDASQLSAGSDLNIMPDGDPAGANNLVKGLVDVQRDGERGFTGTLDLTKSPTADQTAMKALGDKATAVPFTAKVDDKGRLVELSVQMSAVAAGMSPLVTTYSDFGTPVTVEKPSASETVEAPKEILGMFNA